jgi:hypothetical protein
MEIDDVVLTPEIKRKMIMSAKRKIATAVAIGALFFTANEASAQHQTHGHDVRHLPRAFERAYGYVPRQVPQCGPARDVYCSYSLGRQPFQNPDRDFSIENLRSHPSG